MNVAICFSGKYSKPQINIDFIKKIKGFDNLDIFFHMWSNKADDELLRILKPKKFLFETQKDFNRESLILMEPLAKSKELYCSDNYNSFVEKWIWLPEKKNISKRVFYGKNLNYDIKDLNYDIKDQLQYVKNLSDYGFSILSKFYSRLCSNELKNYYERKNNVKYDLVIRARMDTDIKYEIDLKTLDQSKLYTVYSGDRNDPDEGAIWAINDLFAISNAENMNTYCSAYFHLHETLLDAFNNEKLNYLCHESLLLQHLTNQNVPMQKIKNNIVQIIR